MMGRKLDWEKNGRPKGGYPINELPAPKPHKGRPPWWWGLKIKHEAQKTPGNRARASARVRARPISLPRFSWDEGDKN